MAVISERHEATVSNNQDPDKRGRIKVTCVGLIGDEDSEVPHWVEPALDWGVFVVPDIGEIVEVVAVVSTGEDEVPGQSTIDNLDLRWHGVRHYGNTEADRDEDKRPIPGEMKTNYGKRRGFITPQGHVLLFDDTEGDLRVSLTWVKERPANGAVPAASVISRLEFEPDGSLRVGLLDQHQLHMQTEGKTFSVSMNGGAGILTLNAETNEWTVSLDGGAHVLKVVPDDMKLTLSGQESFDVAGSGGAAVAKVGGPVATDSACRAIPMSVLWTLLQTVLIAHVHPSAAGPTGPSPAPFPAWNGHGSPPIESPNLKVPPTP